MFLKYLLYLFKNPLVDVTLRNILPRVVFRPLYINKYIKTKEFFKDCSKMKLPLVVVNWALMYGLGDDKPYFDKEYKEKVQLYKLDPICFKEDKIKKYSKFLPIEVSFKYVNRRFYLTGVKRIKEE